MEVTTSYTIYTTNNSFHTSLEKILNRHLCIYSENLKFVLTTQKHCYYMKAQRDNAEHINRFTIYEFKNSINKDNDALELIPVFRNDVGEP